MDRFLLENILTQFQYTQENLECIPAERFKNSGTENYLSIQSQTTHILEIRLGIYSVFRSLPTSYLPFSEYTLKASLFSKAQLLSELLKTHELFSEVFEHIDLSALSKPFRTMFGNISSHQNYLFILLQEEIHHRAQLFLLMRQSGIIPIARFVETIATLSVPQNQNI